MLKKVSIITITAIVGFVLGAAGMAAGIFNADPSTALSGESGSVRMQPDQITFDPARPVKSMVVTAGPNTKKRTFPGLIEAANETRLAFRVSGTLHELNGTVGRKVKKGDLVARLDPRDFKINIQRLEAALDEARATLTAMTRGARKEDIAALTAQVNAAKANLTRSKKQLDRLDMLIKKQVIPKSAHDLGVADYQTSKASHDAAVQNLEKGQNGARKEEIQAAEARIRQLEASLAAARYALSDTRLTAPFDGVINRKFMENYETVAAGHPVISLLDFSTVDVKTAIPEEILLKRNAITRICCTLDAYPGQIFEAAVKELGLKTCSANQSFPLTVSLDVPAGIDIQPGMTASLTIEYPENDLADAAVRLPAEAVFADRDGTSCAWKIDPATGNVSKAPIQVSSVNHSELTVISGLNRGDRIVTAGARFLTDGQKVKIMKDTK